MNNSLPPATDLHLASRQPSRLIFWGLLALVVLLGGYLRFVGLNWDDFTGSHPDERFLTQNLLPNIGGGLEFTPDDKNFPSESLFIRVDNVTITNRVDVQLNPSILVGTIEGTVSPNFATWWLDETRVRVFPTVDATLTALANNEIGAILAPSNQSFVTSAGSDLGNSTYVTSIDTFASEEIQRIRCQALYPNSNGVGGYFDARCSSLNPHNASAGFYAYGTLPLFLAHFAADFVRSAQDSLPSVFDFQGYPLVWRFLSAIFDIGSIIFLYFIGSRLHNRWTGLISALLYAVAPLAIEKSHFGTVNAITAFFVVLALWAAAGVLDRGRYWYYAVFGVAFGAAMSGRINILPLVGVLGLATIVQCAPILDAKVSGQERTRILMWHVGGLILAAFVTVLTFRIANPYAFVGPGFFGLTPNSRFLDDLASAQYGVSGMSDAPPNYQWVGRMDYVYPLKDIILWGMGLATATLAIFGFLWSGLKLIRREIGSTRNLFLFAWVLVYFGYMGKQWVMTMRYYLPLYGALALLAGWAVVELVRVSYHHKMPITRHLLGLFGSTLGLIPVFYVVNGLVITETAVVAGVVAIVLWIGALFFPTVQRAHLLAVFTVAFAVLWGFMYTNIYRHELTRVQASRWVWENISGDFSMKVEGAPDGTPLINIALQNARSESSTSPENLSSSATRYFINQPVLTEFTAPATGTITAINAPHLADLRDNLETESLYVSISAKNERGDLELLIEQTLTANFTRDRHVLGDSYVIQLDTPLKVIAGGLYTFKAEAIQGEFAGGGAVVLTEGDWDDRLTTIMVCHLPDGLTLKDDPKPGLASYNDCNGMNSWYALVNSYDMAMSYPIDDSQKLESIRTSLQVGDYLTITSNRFYDSEARNLARFPLTYRYYDALFKGELGYELVESFDDSYAFMGLSVSDQYLPFYKSPMWFNEFEADEAFHVYDHPATFIFKKTADYDQQKVDAILDSVPLNRIETVPLDVVPGSEIVGAIYWDSLQQDAAPNTLMQAPDQKAINQQGGTWSQRFNSASLLNTNQVAGVVGWWLTIMLYGFVTFPILFTIFPRMADRGYGFTKFLGMFLIAYIAWVFAGLKVPMWSQIGIVLSMCAVTSLSAYLAWHRRTELRAYIRDNWKRLATIEALTLVLFLVLIGVRLSNPDTWHQWKGGEKPMDFAYFNAVLRTTTFPVSDAWYAGGNLNYYYWGYVLVGSPVLLLQIVPSFAYNLIIPTLFALAGIGAFSTAFNIVSHWRVGQGEPNDNLEPSRRRLGNPYLAGIAAALLCVVLGNLDTIRVLGNGIAQLGGYQTPTGIENWLSNQMTDPNSGEANQLAVQERVNANYLSDRIGYEVSNSVSLVTGFFNGLRLAATGAPLPIGTDRWYWGPSRVLSETPGVEGGAISEMPYFTFVYADLHAHMMNMPVLLFVILFIFSELMNAKNDQRTFFALVVSVVVGALTVGMIQAINTWDLPTFLLFSVIGLGYAWWLRFEGFSRKSLTFMLAYVGGFVTMSFVASLAYRTWYAATYGSVQLWTGGKTPFWAYFDIWGLFLFLVVSLLVWESFRWLRVVKVKALRGWGTYILLMVVSFLLLMFFLVGVAAINYQVALMVVPLIVWIGALFFRPRQSPEMQFVLVIVGLALSLTLGVEVIVLGGDIGRQNTVFKFYIQAWILLSIAGGCAVAWLVKSSENWTNRLTMAWFIPLFILVFLAGMFPIMATRGRSYDRIAPETPLTLNGMDYMQYATHQLIYTPASVDLKDDYNIIRWLQENVQGTPYIIEGREGASEYSWTSRISINTGLPSVLGWRFHQTQQRTFDPLTRLIDSRENNIKFFYNTTDLLKASKILQYYDISYVIVSGLERAVATPEGIAKFDELVSLDVLHIVYQTGQEGQARIYEVNRDGLARYISQTSAK